MEEKTKIQEVERSWVFWVLCSSPFLAEQLGRDVRGECSTKTMGILLRYVSVINLLCIYYLYHRIPRIVPAIKSMVNLSPAFQTEKMIKSKSILKVWLQNILIWLHRWINVSKCQIQSRTLSQWIVVFNQSFIAMMGSLINFYDCDFCIVIIGLFIPFHENVYTKHPQQLVYLTVLCIINGANFCYHNSLL